MKRIVVTGAAGQFGGPDGRWNVYVRLILNSGSGSADEDTEDESTLLRVLCLVE